MKSGREEWIRMVKKKMNLFRESEIIEEEKKKA